MLLTLGLGVLSMIGGAESVTELHSDGTPDLPHHRADQLSSPRTD